MRRAILLFGLPARVFKHRAPVGQIAGDLTIKGVRRAERFTAQFINTIPDANATSFGIQLSGQVDRNVYGVSGYSSFVGPRVDLRIRAYLNAA